ncbi:unnamed protein product, partial [Notodromas monacha]
MCLISAGNENGPFEFTFKWAWVSFSDHNYFVNETHRHVEVLVDRKGYLGEQSSIGISVQPLTAVRGKDFELVPLGIETGLVEFAPGQRRGVYRIKILDDPNFERPETFALSLVEPKNAAVVNSELKSAIVQIEDPEDEPTVFIATRSYSVEEKSGSVKIVVHRKGDISNEMSVDCLTRDGTAVGGDAKATAPVDFVWRKIERSSASAYRLNFKPEQETAHCIIDIINDVKYEEDEQFGVYLSNARGGRIAEHETSVTILADAADVPLFYFGNEEYRVGDSEKFVNVTVWRTGPDLSQDSRVTLRLTSVKHVPDRDGTSVAYSSGNMVGFEVKSLTVNENSGVVSVPVKRWGDLSYPVTLACHTRSRSASAGSDFVERRANSEDSVIEFKSEPMIQFASDKLRIAEPKTAIKSPGRLAVELVRTGDVSSSSVIHIYSKDGSAKAGKDFEAVSKDVRFAVGSTSVEIEVKVFFDNVKEDTETFFLLLRPVGNKANGVVKSNRRKTTVQILDGGLSELVAFPAPPIVASLRDLDFAAVAQIEPMNGYPLVCISSCHRKHPDFANGTEKICNKEGIDDSMTRFRWKISGSTSEELLDLNDDTIFTRVDRITLDSIYLTPGGRVQCLTTAVAIDGKKGIETASNIVRISKTRGLCPRKHDAFGSEPFLSKIRYSDDPSHPDLVEFDVIVPHADGLLPVFSTRPILKPLQITLSPLSTVRTSEHFCSNLLLPEEQPTRFGFNMKTTFSRGDNFREIGEVEPYQLDASLRGKEAVVLYSHLDLDSCSWMFRSFFNMSDLMSKCGGMISTENQVLNLVQSFVSVTHGNMYSMQRLTFMYNTAVLSDESVAAVSSRKSSGKLHPQSMRLLPDGRLEVKFKTKPFFRGFYLLQNNEGDKSYVISKDHPHLQFDIKLLKTEDTIEKPQQEWIFISDYAVGDYSGTYSINMIPCLMSPSTPYASTSSSSEIGDSKDSGRAPMSSMRLPPEASCTAQKMSGFTLKIRFQQLSDPVPSKFSLNTQFLLLKKKISVAASASRIHTDNSAGILAEFSSDSEEAFVPEDYIHGVLRMNPLENWGGHFGLRIEKCFLCAGDNSHVPKFNPNLEEYGCILPSPRLKHHFKILAAYGTQWFVHCLYTIRSTSDKPPVSPQSINRDKRSANSDFPEEDSDIYDYHHAVFDPLHNEDLSRVRRSLEHTRHAESSDRRDSNKQTRRRKNKTKFRDKSSVSAS